MDMIVACICLIIGFYYLYEYFRSEAMTFAPPGPKGYPIIGNTFQLNGKRIHEHFTGLAVKYGEIFQVKIFGSRTVVLNSSELISKAFSGDEFKHVFNDRPRLYFGEEFYFGSESIAFRKFDKEHGELRKVFTKGLHVYGDGIPKFENIVRSELERVMVKVENSGDQGFEVIGLIRRSACNVLSMLLIGTEATEADINNFLDFDYAEDFFLNPLTNTLLCNLPFLRYVPGCRKEIRPASRAKQAILHKYFQLMKSTYEAGTIRGVVDYFIADQLRDVADGKQPVITDAKIQATILGIISAGVLTTSSVLPSTILCLITHPKYQIRLQQELDRVIGRDRDPCISDKGNCDFLEAVVMETMRYITPAPSLLPHASVRDTLFGGYSIQANSVILANVWYVHHDDKIWGDPWNFRPERFLDDDGKLLSNSHVYMKSVLPFGTGRRRCPGESLAKSRIFLYLATFFKTWTFSAVPGKCGSSDPRSGDFDLDVTLKPKPFFCVAKRRF